MQSKGSKAVWLEKYLKTETDSRKKMVVTSPTMVKMNFDAIVKGHRYMLGVVCRNEAGSYLITLSFSPLPDLALGMSNYIFFDK